MIPEEVAAVVHAAPNLVKFVALTSAHCTGARNSDLRVVVRKLVVFEVANKQRCAMSLTDGPLRFPLPSVTYREGLCFVFELESVDDEMSLVKNGLCNAAIAAVQRSYQIAVSFQHCASIQMSLSQTHNCRRCASISAKHRRLLSYADRATRQLRP